MRRPPKEIFFPQLATVTLMTMTTNGSATSSEAPIVTFKASPKGPKCPFTNSISFQLFPGSCVLLKGNSGAGKTTLSTYLASLCGESTLEKLDIQATCQWDPSIPKQEQCGVLFQQTTLLDELTVAGNVSVALGGKQGTVESKQFEIKKLLESVGLDYARDGGKKPSELSGGMARRASLALQLAQKKHVIVLDEPFTGLDEQAATSVAKELMHLRNQYKTALLLISHEENVSSLITDPNKTKYENAIVRLQHAHHDESASHPRHHRRNLYGTTFHDRFMERLKDYVLWSLPLILLTFLACGLAIAMLSADSLSRINVTDHVLTIVDQEVRPLLKLLTGGEEASPMALLGIKMKVRSMLNTAVPEAKSTLYALGIAKLFFLEIGPLITALLLCGRIGGSYSGKVASMQATSQVKLLKTLGIDPVMWTLAPALAAAVIASPLLTLTGTALAIFLGGLVGPRYGVGNAEIYRNQVEKAVYPTLRVQFEAWAGFHTTVENESVLVELVTWPPIFHWLKATVYILIILGVAETCCRLQRNLTTRHVPHVITSSVVISSLLVIIADWGFSQLWLLRV
jgi:ABC-type nitrate/sulfonate/bicarbonate transport system ATPase subunit